MTARSEVVDGFYKSKIMEVLKDSKRRMNCEQISKKSGISRSTAYRYLEELVLLGSIKLTKKGKRHYWEFVDLSSDQLSLPLTTHQPQYDDILLASILEKFNNFSNEMTMEIVNLIKVKSNERINEKAKELALQSLKEFFLTTTEDVRKAFFTSHDEVKVSHVEVPL